MNNKIILLVDDDSDARVLIGKFLGRKGFEVTHAANGTQALSSYRAKRPDCVFLDVRLPDMDGLAVFGKLREIDPAAKIYFVTGSTDSNYFQKKAAQVNASGYLSKPVMLEDIGNVVAGLDKS